MMGGWGSFRHGFSTQLCFGGGGFQIQWRVSKTFPTPIIQLGWRFLIEFDFAIAIGLLSTVTTA